MTLLTLLGDENAWAPSSKICAVSAKEMPHSPLPTCPPPVLFPSPPSCDGIHCPGPTAPCLYLRKGTEAFVASSGFGICKPPSPAWLVSVGHPKVPPPLASIPPPLPSSPYPQPGPDSPQS